MKKHTILIVDDEPIVRESIRDWLINADYQVATAESGEEALQLIDKQDFSVMVFDIRLPGQSGLEVLTKVKAQRPWVKSIIITAYPTEETTTLAKKLGVIDYMIKPVIPEHLEKLIRDAVESVGPEPTVTSIIQEEKAPKSLKLKKAFVISKDDFKSMVKSLSKKMEIIGVKSKDGKYVFDKISNLKDLHLDYDVTVMPPTRYFLPAKEILLKYSVGDHPEIEPVLSDQKRVLVGVHPYDIKAIELLDDIYMTINKDPNYSSRRNNTIIIGVDCLNPSPKSFAPSMGTQTTESGYDLLLTDIRKNYYVLAGTKKGADLLKKYTKATEPTAEDIAKYKEVKDKALTKFHTELNVPRERLAKLLEESYDNPFWESRSKTCLSCGSCVMVCPTCYCFDVKDDMALNLKEGERYRQWDGCMLIDFAKVAGGENFRHDKASRFRHRIYRKGKYIVEKYGRVGCVGCGRCAIACLSDIASPIEAFNSIAEANRVKEIASRTIEDARKTSELYIPEPAELVKVDTLTPNEKAFTFKFKDGKKLNHKPGQFVELSVMGMGEAPFGVSTSPTRNGTFQLGIRNVGPLTNAIHNLKQGSVVGIRGPFGNGFPIQTLEGKDVLLIAGGTGVFPVRSLIQYMLDNRSAFGKVKILVGFRGPSERLFANEIDQWSKNTAIEFHETVDKGDATWTGNVGVITTLIPKIEIDSRKTVAVVVGPPIMYRFVIIELKRRDLADESIILSLERRMKCGVGKCGHCQINGVYVCQDGPVFSLAQLRNLREAI